MHAGATKHLWRHRHNILDGCLHVLAGSDLDCPLLVKAHVPVWRRHLDRPLLLEIAHQVERLMTIAVCCTAISSNAYPCLRQELQRLVILILFKVVHVKLSGMRLAHEGKWYGM